MHPVLLHGRKGSQVQIWGKAKIRKKKKRNAALLYVHICNKQCACQIVYLARAQFFKKIASFNSLCPIEAIWQLRRWSTLIKIMAWCLMAPSHYCWWPIVNWTHRNDPQWNFDLKKNETFHSKKMVFENVVFKIVSIFLIVLKNHISNGIFSFYFSKEMCMS